MTHRRHAHKRRSSSSGFTLMELIVVLGIFTTVVVAASDIFLLAASAQRKLFGLERTQADARFTMEAISREFRTGEIDYEYYAQRTGQAGAEDGEFALPESELALIDSANTKIRFFRTNDAEVCADETSVPCLAVAVGGNAPVSITPKNVAVRSAFFYISPTASPTIFDPVTGVYASNEQQRVTIALTLESLQARSKENTLVSFQTTITNRIYRR